jgi:hypothetical protein
MTAADGFDTGVKEGQGHWPDAPSWLSYSSLKEAEHCPRRWALRRASYPQIWERSGYPGVPSLPALLGDVTHSALEKILEALVGRGCSGPASACAVETLREMGGFTAVIGEITSLRSKELRANPRAKDRVETIEAGIRARMPEMRHRVQAVLSRTQLRPIPSTPGRATTATTIDEVIEEPSERRPLEPGSHAEVTLRAEGIRWTGRADLVTITGDSAEIVDYKTGAPDPSHAEQLRIYALLWLLDSDLNPSGTRSSRLTIAYPTRDVAVEPLSEGDLRALESELQARGDVVREDLHGRPPEARPSIDLCSTCPVRQLCAEYWDFLGEATVGVPATPDGLWGDAEVEVEARNGPRSWWAMVSRGAGIPSSQRIILRTQTESPVFASGNRIRVVNGAVTRDDDSDVVIVTLTSNSETFLLEASPGA